AGRDVRVPEDAERVDATGKVVLPGLVDAHTHLGVHSEGDGWAGQDTNELTDPVTPQVRALDAINPADLGFADAVAGGVLTLNVNPGSGNPIGGRAGARRAPAAAGALVSAAAVAGGVLPLNVTPGSGTPIGGQTAAVRAAGRTVDEMVLRAPSGMKSALGENPKRVYGERKQPTSTRAG